MKTLSLICVLALLICAKGYLIKIPTSPAANRIVPIGWVHIQKLLYPLFENVCEESNDPVVVRLSNEFLSTATRSDYLNPDLFDEIQNLISKNALLSKGDIFTELNKSHLNELKIISELFMGAKNFDAFYKTACWARQKLNCGLFIDAIYLAVTHRRDTVKIFLAAPYEILPNYFVQKDCIYKASSIIRGEQNTDFGGIREEGNSYIIDANYTTNSLNENIDKLSYFHEDVGLNSYYFLLKVRNLRHLLSSDVNRDDWWGLYLYHSIKQLVNRYDLERYSNGLPELESFRWEDINDFIYDSNLIYSNGEDFGQISYINEDAVPTILENIENNLTTVVIHMRDGGYNKAEILNHLMNTLVTSEKSYENLILETLTSGDSTSRSYSVLNHYMTILRDPIYWKLNKKIVEMVDNALSHLPGYTKSQLYFPGVEIVNIDIKKLLTSFDNFEFDITDAMKTQDSYNKFQVKINQQRLNCKPFTIKINVSSQVNQRALVKIFIGPKILPGQFIEKKNNLMLLDCFETTLKIGVNTITKTSNSINNLSEDFTSLKTVKNYLLDAEFGIDSVSPQFIQSEIKFPRRLLLPKGTNEGLPFQIFVFVASFVEANSVGSQLNMKSNSDAILSPGYPLDLDVDIQSLLNLPNSLIRDVMITHKSAIKTKTDNSITPNNDWQTYEYSSTNNEYAKYNTLSARPTYTKQNFDYKSKKGQYGQKSFYQRKSPINNIDEIKIYDVNRNTDVNKEVDKKFVNEDLNKYTVKDQDFTKSIENIDNSNKITSNDDIDYREKDLYYVINKDNDEIQNEYIPGHTSVPTSPKRRYSSLYDLLNPFTTEPKDYVYY